MPDGSVIQELRNRASVAERLIDRVKADLAEEIEAACVAREDELLAEVEKYRLRLIEIAREGSVLAGTVGLLDRASGSLISSRPGFGELEPDSLLKYTAEGGRWIAQRKGAAR